MANNIAFQPVRGTQSQINGYDITEGYVYYAYDTGRIYLDYHGNRYLMSSSSSGGSNSGIIYADGDETTIVNIEDSNNEPTSFYTLPFSIMETHSVVPAEDSLVLNSDGRFFRIIEVDEENQKVTATLLAISGTGGGGGGQVITVEDLFIVPNTSTIGGSFTYVYGQDYEAEVTVTSTTDEEVDLTINFYANNNISSEPIYTILKRGEVSGEPIKINMGQVPYIGSNVAVVLSAEAANSKMPNGVTRRYNNLRFVDMRIEKPTGSDYIPIRTNNNDLQLNYIPYVKCCITYYC